MGGREGSGPGRGRCRAATRAAVVVAALLVPRAAGGDRADGTWDAPHRIDAFPYAHAADTALGVERADRYCCAEDLDESGPEVVYAFTLEAPGRVTAWVTGDVEGAVDLDVHLVTAQPDADGLAACAARGDRVAEADLPAGDFLVSVDSFVTGGLALSGPYVLRVDFAPAGAPRERTVARGVGWRFEVHETLFGGRQTVNVLEVDLTAPGVSVVPGRGEGCETTSRIGERLGAVAGVNAGFFTPSCRAVSLVRVNGRTLASNPRDRPPRAVLGFDARGSPLVEQVAPGEPFARARHALGGVPMLVRDGAPRVSWTEEAARPYFAWSRQPRTAACVTEAGRLLLVTVDGRTPAGLGVSLFDLADHLVSLGCDRALNYDGGGSTTMWVASPAGPGVVSYPSGNGLADHRGERPVANGWFVLARPVDHPPRFATRPPLEAVEGVPWVYDARVVDLDLDPVTFGLLSGPETMTVDPAEGRLRWTPSRHDGATVRVRLGADDGTTVTEQSFEVAVTPRARVGAARAGGPE